MVSLSVDSQNQRLVSGSGDDNLNLYDLKELAGEATDIRPVKSFKEDETVSFVRFNFNREKLVAVTDKYLSVYDCMSLERKRAEVD